MLGKITDECGIMYRDVKVEWDMPNHSVTYGVAHGFDLYTGKCDC